MRRSSWSIISNDSPSRPPLIPLAHVFGGISIFGHYANAWQSAAGSHADEAIERLRRAADEEDGAEKLPVTPGPIVPAREQLADLLLALNRPQEALQEYRAALVAAPGRRGALIGAARAADLLGDTKMASQMRAILSN